MNNYLVIAALSFSLLTACSQPEHLKTKSNLAQWMHQRISRDICFDDSIKECVLHTKVNDDRPNCISELKAYQATCRAQSFPTMLGPVSDNDLNQYPIYQACIASKYLQAHNIAQSQQSSCQMIYQNALKTAGR